MNMNLKKIFTILFFFIPRDQYCGQLQCESESVTPYYIDYGSNYTKVDVNGVTCKYSQKFLILLLFFTFLALVHKNNSQCTKSY